MQQNENMIMSLEDSLTFRDHGVGGSKPGLRGVVVVKQGGNIIGVREVLQKRDNLVVRDGREMTLRKIFNKPGSAPGETEAQLAAKSIMLFGIGSGGTPNNDPFSPFAVTPADRDLSNPVSFRTSSAAAPLIGDDVTKYTDGRSVSGGNVEWYKKLFSNGNGNIVVDPATDEVYNKLSLQISAQDARDKFVNELALYWTRHNPVANDMNARFTDYFMFSRVTFLTEPLPSATSKALDIDYYVYI
jgi:hypothetical protein